MCTAGTVTTVAVPDAEDGAVGTDTTLVTGEGVGDPDEGAFGVGDTDEGAFGVGATTEIVALADTGEILFPGSLTVAVLTIDPVAVEATDTGTVMLPIAGLETPAAGGTKVQVTTLPATLQFAEAKPLPVIVGVPFTLSPAGILSVTVAVAVINPVKDPEIV